MKNKQELINAITKGEGRDYIMNLKPSLQYDELDSLVVELLFITDTLIDNPYRIDTLVEDLADNLAKYLYDSNEF